MNPIEYSMYDATEITDEIYEECSKLFSENYGTYSIDIPERRKFKGDRVAMSAKFMREKYSNIKGCSLVCARVNGVIVGQAFYLRKYYAKHGTMTWVLQLVVKDDYRHKRIGQNLLHSIWGFSNDVAWGLATANPYTVRTLEAATFRRVNPKTIRKHLDQIKCMTDDIWFAKDATITVDETCSLIDTDFAIDHSNNSFEGKWLLGDLKPKHEWLAFTFKSQDSDQDLFHQNFDKLIEFSEERLKEAYSRMEMTTHSWARGTCNEVDHIVSSCDLTQNADAHIIDIGCGIGRHSIELAARGYSVTALDFSANHLKTARQRAADEHVRVDFVSHDCREESFFHDHAKSFDVALCLYDVVGSFPKQSDNLRIVENAYDALRPGGLFFLSVMNYDLTKNLAKPKFIGSIEQNPRILLDLKPSQTMQSSGDVFNPEYYAVDEDTHIIYRKEQFANDGRIPAEYVIRDRRYTKSEICHIVESVGFEIKEATFVRAGHWDIPSRKSTANGAKEILLFCQKPINSTHSHFSIKRMIERWKKRIPH